MAGGLEIPAGAVEGGDASQAEPARNRRALPLGQAVGGIGLGLVVEPPSGIVMPRLSRKAWTASSLEAPSTKVR